MARKFKEIDWTSEMPECDFCKLGGHRPIKPGIYDTPTTSGPWANACHTHMLQHAPKNSQSGFKRIARKL